MVAKRGPAKDFNAERPDQITERLTKWLRMSRLILLLEGVGLVVIAILG